ncbi:helix-turn-helix domain-containing protein [Bacillus gobiensis]|uniref:helix-turn-helix domain-containing protein n=1 Tax=Bacillus gobiensis TaxID=1441095 RepID=UPI003D24DB3B
MENITGKRLEKLREERGWTKSLVAKKLGIKTMSTYANWEYGLRKPDGEMLSKIADLYDVSTDFLHGRTDKRKLDWESKLPELTPNDEKDIQKELEKMIKNLNSKDGYSHFGGHSIEELDKEDKELLIASLENSLKLAKRMAKQKFTPNKYRK